MQQIITKTLDESKKKQLSNMKIIVICVQVLSEYKYVVDSINKLTHFDNNPDLHRQDIDASTLPISNVIFCLGKEGGNCSVEKLIRDYPPDKAEVELIPINRGETYMTKYSTYNCEQLIEAFNNENTQHETFNPITMSGTLVRNIVNCGHSMDPNIIPHSPKFYEMFKYIYSEYLSEPTIRKLYDEIHKGLEAAYRKKRTSEGTGKSKKVKTQAGGKKTKRKRTKKTKRRNSKKYRGIYF
jgi:hypothetical protein